jgi:hypothetical protein
LPETCPAYRCRGRLRTNGEGPVLALVDAAKPDKTQQCRFTALATGLTGWLTAQAESLDGALAQWGEPSVRPERSATDGAVGWTFRVAGGQARRIMDSDLPLSRPLGLAVHDEEATLRVGVRLQPADDAGRAVFALDHAVNVVLAVPLERLGPEVLTAALAAAATTFDTEPTGAEVRGELWRRRQFYRVYALRAADDFAYD